MQLRAQSNAPVRLALISETDQAATAVDILTAQFSSNSKIQLLERDQIARVYREQGLSVANTDYLKVGQILGADGLLLLQTTIEGTNQFLNIRLIAIKPGVVLTAERFSWPMKDLTEWSASFTGHLDVFLPKLTVLIKDAIPLSVVNLRSAVNSSEAGETERQLKLLTIQRLSREPQFFVLERQKMQLLAEEKDLKLDDSAFWNGSYLLEGVVDQNGYSKETITINARLTPPKGGTPLEFEVRGSRTNLAEVVNQLASKVNEALKVNSAIKGWNASDEAAQYFDEAQWALRWGVYSEAQAAADSAWALGKQDMDCANVRIKAYMSEVQADAGGFQTGEATYGQGFNEAYVLSDMREMSAQHTYGLIYKIQHVGDVKVVNYVFASGSPDPKNIDRALHALDLYYEFSRTPPDGEPKVLSRGKGWNDRHDSDWYQLGIDDLVAASQVLQDFNFIPESQKPVADKLAELRSLARSVADLISKSPSVHDSYFVGDRIATYDELYKTIGEDDGGTHNIFHCKAQWGCFWQETPEDCVALYRDLMSSPVFSYIHTYFWLRDLQTPRLVAWNETGRRRIPVVWEGFVQELEVSTNVLLQLEAKALAFADADSDKDMAVACTNLFNAIFENHDALVNNNVDVLYLDWGTGSLIEEKASSGVASDTKDALQHRFYSEYFPKIEGMEREYRQTTANGMNPKGKEVAFERQEQYLKENKPFDNNEFVQLFILGFKDYSKAQALEVLPLLASYKSNLVAQAEELPNNQKWQPRIGAMQVGQVEANVNRILNPPAPNPQLPVQASAPAPTPIAKPAVVPLVVSDTPKPPTSVNAPEIVTNVLAVNNFLEIPLDGLQGDQISNVRITAHHWLEGKLLVDFEYDAQIYSLDKQGAWTGSRGATLPAIAILDPAIEHWDVIGCPEVGIAEQNTFYNRTTFWHGELLNSDGGQTKKYDIQGHQWQVLPISDGNNYELFNVNDHLYEANGSIIFEILEGGKSTRILASIRRNPPVSALDQETLGKPTLFEGPNHSLRVSTSSKIFTWTGNDWHEDSSAPPASSQPDIFADGVLFRQNGFLEAAYQNDTMFRRSDGTYGVLVSQDTISCLAYETNVATLLLEGNNGGWRNHSMPARNTIQGPKPLWKMPADMLPDLPIALRQSDLYIMEDRSAVHTIVNERHEILQDELNGTYRYNAALLCFSRDLPLPKKLFLQFDPPDAKEPTWMFSSTNLLIFGLEKSRGFIPGQPMGGSGVGHKPGVWIMPLSQLDSAITVQKRIQLEQMAKEGVAAGQAQNESEQARKNILAKYDQNHNGVIDADEKEAALDDPAFIEAELDVIDANQNGLLDAEVLVWFDANANKILEPKEQAGIEIAQHLLAERLLKRFDADGNGLLDRSEFSNLVQSSLGANATQSMTGSLLFPDVNHDGYVDLGELETYLKRQMFRGLHLRGVSGAPLLMDLMRLSPSQPVDPRQMFKAEVEAYWQNPHVNQ